MRSKSSNKKNPFFGHENHYLTVHIFLINQELTFDPYLPKGSPVWRFSNTAALFVWLIVCIPFSTNFEVLRENNSKVHPLILSRIVLLFHPTLDFCPSLLYGRLLMLLFLLLILLILFLLPYLLFSYSCSKSYFQASTYLESDLLTPLPTPLPSDQQVHNQYLYLWTVYSVQCTCVQCFY